MSCKCAKFHSLIIKGTIFTPNCWTTKTKPLEAWRLRRLTSFGINLPEIANILTGMRHVGIYHLLYSEVLGSCYLLAQRRQMEVKTPVIYP